MTALPEITEADMPYLDAIERSLGNERPARVSASLHIIRQYVRPETMPSVDEFSEVFETQYEAAGRPLMKSSQFAFYMAGYINSHWETGGATDGDVWFEKDEDSALFLDMTYTALLRAADATVLADRVFDLEVVMACLSADRQAVPLGWAWYLAESRALPTDVVLAARIGCSLPRVVEAGVGKLLTAPPPGDVYLLEEMEVPFWYYQALVPALHISDIVRAYITGMPLEYALATAGK